MRSTWIYDAYQEDALSAAAPVAVEELPYWPIWTLQGNHNPEHSADILTTPTRAATSLTIRTTMHITGLLSAQSW